ncbi:MAG: FkbM family methyltransferase [Methylococcaceae bacterium]|nr:FkbM family methyltransferase [Methylococcaceae bacterium]
MTLTRVDKLLQALQSARLTEALFRHRVLAGAEHRHVLAQGLASVVDIGANRGQFALAARRWAPAARVISFEPLPEPAAKFRAVFADDPRVTLHQVAISPERGETTIHVSARDDSSSLLPITAMQNNLFPGTAEAGTATITVGPLANYVPAEAIESPALLKLDVQGFELQALQGCEDLLYRFTHVYVECSFVELYAGQAFADEVISWLRERGFVLQGVYNLAYDRSGKAIQADFLFGRRG